MENLLERKIEESYLASTPIYEGLDLRERAQLNKRIRYASETKYN